MNRLQPCAECGCPVVFHHVPQDPVAGRGRMACEECSRDEGKEHLCASPTD